MDDFSERDREHFHALLIKRRTELQQLDQTGREAAETVELDQSRVGRLSRMDAMQAQAMSKEINRRRAQELGRIAAALRRIDEGDYGYCLNCDEPIARGRLQVDPTAGLCIQCATGAENR